jgi:hypothetical protein
MTTSSTACAGNVLCASATACKSPTCTVDADCVSGFFCNAGACKAKLPVGMPCGTGTQCQNGNCSSDSICCSTACSASCQGCNIASTGVATGTCAARPSSVQCSGACGVGFGICGTSCVATSWNFDQGSILVNGNPYGWHYTDPDREFPGVVISYVPGVSHTAATNKGALGVFLPILFGSGAPLIFGVDICPTPVGSNLERRSGRNPVISIS